MQLSLPLASSDSVNNYQEYLAAVFLCSFLLSFPVLGYSMVFPIARGKHSLHVTRDSFTISDVISNEKVTSSNFF